jgi:hypothetical protein
LPDEQLGAGEIPGRAGSVMDKLVLQVQQEFVREDLGISRCPIKASVGIMNLAGVAARHKNQGGAATPPYREEINGKRWRMSVNLDN